MSAEDRDDGVAELERAKAAWKRWEAEPLTAGRRARLSRRLRPRVRRTKRVWPWVGIGVLTAGWAFAGVVEHAWRGPESGLESPKGRVPLSASVASTETVPAPKTPPRTAGEESKAQNASPSKPRFIEPEPSTEPAHRRGPARSDAKREPAFSPTPGERSLPGKPPTKSSVGSASPASPRAFAPRLEPPAAAPGGVRRTAAEGPTVAEEMDRADRLRRKRDWAGAQAIYARVARRSWSFRAEASLRWAECLEQSRGPRAALEVLARPRRASPLEPELLALEARLWRQVGDPERAKKVLRRMHRARGMSRQP